MNKKQIYIFTIFFIFLKINIEAISFSGIYQSSKKNINTVKSFIGNKIFNPKDFYPKTIKSFLFSPKETILKNIRENTFKTLFYTYLSLVSAHHTTLTTDLLLKDITEDNYKSAALRLVLFTIGFPLVYFYYSHDHLCFDSSVLSEHKYYLFPTRAYIIKPLMTQLRNIKDIVKQKIFQFKKK